MFHSIHREGIPMIKNIFIICICFFLQSCGNSGVTAGSTAESGSDSTSTEDSNPMRGMTPEEIKARVTNPVLAGIFKGKSPQEIDRILSEQGSQLFIPNELGDTSLGEAIKLKQEETALSLLKHYQCDKRIAHRNNKGESYVYLASQAGYQSLISGIADICFKRKEKLWDGEDYEFADLDPKTHEGNKALHVAANSLIAKTLIYEYTRGDLELTNPWTYYFHTNKKEQTFLHTAVEDGRLDLVRWIVQQECKEEEDSWEKAKWVGWMVTLGKKALSAVQNQTIAIEDLINYQDIDDNAAIHLAAKTQNIEAVRVLSHCRWTDFASTNIDEDIPLQVFLKELDSSVSSHSMNIKGIFTLLSISETMVNTWFTDTSTFVDHQNNKGDSSLHIAARLADPFFYNHLTQFGDTLLPNNKGGTPEQIFKATQRQLKSLTSPAVPDSEEATHPENKPSTEELDYYTQKLPEPHYAFTYLAIKWDI